MKPDRWRRIEEIFEAATGMPDAARAAYLDEACEGDPELRREVESLLAFDAPGGAPMDAPVQSMAALMAADGEDDGHIGRKIGPWRITGMVGQGGMGIVYLAVRDDDQYRKQVAIKCIKRGMDTALVLQRFRHERQILASLEHPNIAHLLDGGTADDGLPYFVMEYVAGTPVTRHCEDRKLSLIERLELFRQICAGVQHAHRHMVVHRDLKPDNILVAEDGVPKLLDFGIAKLLDPSLTGEPAPLTATQVRIFTPEYASPEQIRGEPVTAATDIYALGAILFELLTGQKAQRMNGASALELDRAICLEDTEKPSAAALRNGSTTESRKLKSQLTGDLDTIVLTAMRKEPGRRYASVEQFSEDLRRYMNDLPVQARSDTVGYRTAKFVRRNYPLLIAAAAVFVSLVAGIVVSVVQERRAREQARRAEFRFQQVRKLANTFLFDFHDEIQFLPGSTKARAMLVKTALEYLDSLARESETDRTLLDELASAYEKVGQVQSGAGTAHLGDTKGSLNSFSKSVELRKRVADGPSAPPEAGNKLAYSLIRLGTMIEDTGRIPEALATYEKSLAISQALGAKPAAVNTMMNMALANDRIGDVLLLQGHPREALERFRTSLGFREAIAAAKPGDRPARRAVVLSHLRIGKAASDEASLRKALSMAEGLAKLEPDNARYARDVAMAWERLGSLQHETGKPREALGSYGKLLSIGEKQVARDPENAQAQRDLLAAHGFLGDVRAGLGEWPKALEHYTVALATCKQLVEHDPANARGQSDLGEAHYNLGKIHRALGNQSESRARYLKAVSVWEPLLTASSDSTDLRGRLALAHAALGRDYAASRQWPLANTSYSKSLDMLQELKSRGVLGRDREAELGRIQAELAQCDLHLAKPAR